MSEPISKVHDHFFKMAMQDKRVACEFFQMHLPADLQQQIQWQTLKSYPTVQNAQLYREDITDVAFEVVLDEEQALLHLIVDHQSTPDPMMAFRTENYRHNLIANYVSQHKEAQKIPLVISLVLYHGVVSWKYDTDIRSLIDAPKHLVDKYAFKPFILVDLTTIDDEILRQSVWVGAMQLVQKHIFEKNILLCLRAIQDAINQLSQVKGGIFIGLMLEYIMSYGERDRAIFFEFIEKELFSETKGEIMTIAEQLIAEGRQQGMQQGMQQVARNLLVSGLDVDFVSKNTGLDIEVLRQLKNETKH